MKILITGGNGFFASRFHKFYKDTYDILALGRNELDITDGKAIMEKIKSFNPDLVIHTAAIADTGICEKNPELSYKINVEGSVNVAKACLISKSKLIFLSSEQVYNGNMEEGPYDEDTVPVPNTVYGKHKLEAEEKMKNILHEIWILRLTWLFGMPERNLKTNSNILMNVLAGLFKGKTLLEPVNEYRGMTYVYELIENIPKIFEIPYGVYNTGSENDLSRYDIACSILKELGREEDIKILIVKDEIRFKDKARDLRISNKKFKELGISFSNTKDGIKKALKEYNLK